MTENGDRDVLLKAFRSAWGERDEASDFDDSLVAEALVAFMLRARTAWPLFSADAPPFIAYLAGRMPVSEDVVQDLGSVNAGDLYLAYCCVEGEPGAIEAFHDQFDAVLLKAAARVEKQGVNPEDVRQQLFEHLLIARDDRPAAIALYAGRGSLRAYLRVASLHRALKILRATKEVPMSNDMDFALKIACEDEDPEVRALKERYRVDFKEAFQSVVLDLKPEERNLLRYHYLSGLNTRKISALLGVDQSTVVRWLSRLRGRLLDETRDRLMERLGLGNTEFKSIMNLVQSQLDISMERVLGEDAEKGS